MQATRWTSSDRSTSRSLGRAEQHARLGWYLALALLTTLTETVFVLSSMSSWLAAG